MTDKIVINTSPLIVLFKSQLAYLLPQVFTEIIVPSGVWNEIVEAGKTGYRAIIDDAAARRVAKTLNIPFMGTMGMLLLANKKGLISAISESIQAIQDAGLWVNTVQSVRAKNLIFLRS